jgi:hypothetical protein
MAETRRFAGLASRSELRAANNLGVIYAGTNLKQKYRKKELELYEMMMEHTPLFGNDVREFNILLLKFSLLVLVLNWLDHEHFR